MLFTQAIIGWYSNEVLCKPWSWTYYRCKGQSWYVSLMLSLLRWRIHISYDAFSVMKHLMRTSCHLDRFCSSSNWKWLRENYTFTCTIIPAISFFLLIPVWHCTSTNRKYYLVDNTYVSIMHTCMSWLHHPHVVSLQKAPKHATQAHLSSIRK